MTDKKETFYEELTDEFTLRRSSGGFTLDFTSRIEKQKRIGGELKATREGFTKYYGTLYQGLQGFVREYYERANSLDDMVKRVEDAVAIVNSAMTKINSADQAIVDLYKIVKVSN